jgi:malonyl-CoA O-methyltransferase
MDTERLTVTWGDPARMCAELHALGGDARKTRPRGLVTPRRLRSACAVLRERQNAVDPDGGAPPPLAATFELVYGHAWCPPAKKLPDGYSPIEFRPNPRRSEGAR